MFEKLKIKKNSGFFLILKRNTEIVALCFLVIITIISTTYYNKSKKKIYLNYKNIINNIYLKKTVNHWNNSCKLSFSHNIFILFFVIDKLKHFFLVEE